MAIKQIINKKAEVATKFNFSTLDWMTFSLFY